MDYKNLLNEVLDPSTKYQFVVFILSSGKQISLGSEISNLDTIATITEPFDLYIKMEYLTSIQQIRLQFNSQLIGVESWARKSMQTLKPKSLEANCYQVAAHLRTFIGQPIHIIIDCVKYALTKIKTSNLTKLSKTDFRQRNAHGKVINSWPKPRLSPDEENED